MNFSLSFSLGLPFSLFTWTLDIAFVILITLKLNSGVDSVGSDSKFPPPGNLGGCTPPSTILRSLAPPGTPYSNLLPQPRQKKNRFFILQLPAFARQIYPFMNAAASQWIYLLAGYFPSLKTFNNVEIQGSITCIC